MKPMMKPILKLSIVVVVLLFALTACNLFKTINVSWAINFYSEPDIPADSFIDINYDVWNAGKYDLEGVKLHFSVHIAGVGYYDAWTPAVSLAEGQISRNNVFTIDVFPYHLGNIDILEVVAVDMDKPKD
jgi:hypothetical protein